MKSILAFIIIASLIGCGNKEQAARTQRMEQRISRLEQCISELETLEANHFQTSATTLTEMQEEISRVVTNNVNVIEFLASVNSTPSHTAHVRPSSGIPIVIYNQIRADASKKWPRDYDMQKYEIDKQIAAYKQLSP